MRAVKGLTWRLFRVWGLELRVQDLGFRVWGLGFRVWGLGFGVERVGAEGHPSTGEASAAQG